MSNEKIILRPVEQLINGNQPEAEPEESYKPIITSNLKNAPQNDPFLEKFYRSILDQTKDYPAPVSVIDLIQNLEAITFLSLKSFSLWQGKAKSKKTTVLALAIAAFISRIESTNNIRFQRTMDGVVLFFDNEQGESYAARTMKTILRIAGMETSPNLIYCDLREYSPTERLKIIEAGIKSTPNVKIVVVDGIVDVMKDFMSSEEGENVIGLFLRLCSVYNIHIAGVLHQNKKDSNARAHVGTIASNKCEREISAEVDKHDPTISTISSVNNRGPYFQPFNIKWEKGCLPKICQTEVSLIPSKLQETKGFKESISEAREIFGLAESLNYSALLDGIMDKCCVKNGKRKVSKDTAKRRIGEWVKMGVIDHREDQYFVYTELPSGLKFIGGSVQ